MGLPPETAVGLFEPYPVTGDGIRDAADATRGRLAAIDGVAGDVERDHQAVVRAVEGILADSMADAPAEVITRATVLNRKAEYAAGCLEYFGLAVDAYNTTRHDYPRSVADLNLAWSQARSRDDETRAELVAENREAAGRLDDAATEVSQLLAAGPDDHDSVRTLWAAGALPFYAPLVFTDADLTRTPTTEAVVHGLEAYLDANPCQRDNPYLQALQASVIEPPPSQAEIDESLERLRAAGLLGEDEEPDAYYLTWLEWTLRKGLGPEDVVERAEQEDVSMERFDPLRELESIQDPDGRLYLLLDSDQGAKDVARLTELVHGGTPSITDSRRSNNEWTYDGFLFGDSDVEMVLDHGGAVVATPVGTMMAAPGPEGRLGLPNLVDLFASRGGTTYMETYVINGSFDDPEGALRERIEAGTDDGSAHESKGEHPGDSTTTGQDDDGDPVYDGSDSLTHRLLHERLHSAQWGRWGWRFAQHYVTDADHHEDTAISDWGGYHGDAVEGWEDEPTEMTHDWPVDCEPADQGTPPPNAYPSTTTPEPAPEPEPTTTIPEGPPPAYPPNTTTTTQPGAAATG